MRRSQGDHARERISLQELLGNLRISSFHPPCRFFPLCLFFFFFILISFSPPSSRPPLLFRILSRFLSDIHGRAMSSVRASALSPKGLIFETIGFDLRFRAIARINPEQSGSDDGCSATTMPREAEARARPRVRPNHTMLCYLSHYRPYVIDYF